MDAVSELLLNGIVRATLCTTLAALATLLILPILGISSARSHRVAWVLVIFQGWLLLPLTLTVSAANEAPAEQLSIASSISSAPTQAVQPQMNPHMDEPSTWQAYGKQTTFAVWLLGTLAVLSFYLKRYYSLIAHAPLGSVPESNEWKEEWCEAVNAISARSNVHFRVTNSAGPLLCFVPYVYLVLVPKILWGSLSREDRLAILRHELAHLKHGDLWKNLLIRIFALPQWFNPLVWLAVRRFEEAGEWACDEDVIASSGLASTGYADTLIRVADFSAGIPCGVVAASGGLLTRRIKRLLSSSNKEVSQVKNLALPALLLTIAAGQAIRIESVYADEPVRPAASTTRAEALAKWHSEPYQIEPPDVLSFKIRWEANDAIEATEKELPVKDDALTDFITSNTVTPSRKPRVAISSRPSIPYASLSKQPTVLAPIAKGFGFVKASKCVVGPDGEIAPFGKLFVAGMTTNEVQKAIIDKLPKQLGFPTVIVDVAESHSKVVYVVTKQTSGDNVARIPIPHAGHFTVMDAFVCIELKADAISHAYVLSPYGPNNSDDRLDIDLKALRSKSNEAANFDLLPGDRVFIQKKNLPLEKNISPPVVTPPSEARVSSYDGREQTQNNTVRFVVSYSVADFVKTVDGPTDATAELQKIDKLIDSITSTVDVEQWVENGGEENTIHPFPTSRSLVVNCTKSTHDKLAVFFQTLRISKKILRPDVAISPPLSEHIKREFRKGDILTVLLTSAVFGEVLQGTHPEAGLPLQQTYRMAAKVMDVRPNGCLVIEGNQTIRRDDVRCSLGVSGVIRPEAIAPDATIAENKISELMVDVLTLGE